MHFVQSNWTETTIKYTQNAQPVYEIMKKQKQKDMLTFNL